jgi:hypothetical protein
MLRKPAAQRPVTGPSRLARLGAAASAAGAGARKAAGAAGAGLRKAAGAAGAAAAAAAAAAKQKAMGAYRKLPPPASFLTSWPVMLLLVHTFVVSLGMYFYFKQYNKYKGTLFTSTLPFIAASHTNVIIFVILSFMWTSLYYYTSSQLQVGLTGLLRIASMIFGGLTEVGLLIMIGWLFADTVGLGGVYGAKADQEQDIKDANSKADSTAATKAAQEKNLCDTACKGDRSNNATTISANCPDETCP